MWNIRRKSLWRVWCRVWAAGVRFQINNNWTCTPSSYGDVTLKTIRAVRSLFFAWLPRTREQLGKPDCSTCKQRSRESKPPIYILFNSRVVVTGLRRSLKGMKSSKNSKKLATLLLQDKHCTSETDFHDATLFWLYCIFGLSSCHIDIKGTFPFKSK